MKQILKYTKFISGAFLTGSLLFTSCTGQFEQWNINPNEVTPAQMTYDNLNTGAYFTQMVKGVFIVGNGADGVGSVSYTHLSVNWKFVYQHWKPVTRRKYYQKNYGQKCTHYWRVCRKKLVLLSSAIAWMENPIKK